MTDQNTDPNQQTPATPTWFGKADPGYVTAKGWDGVEAVITAHQNLEKIQRTPASRTVVLPEKEDDAEGWSQVHARMGRPESPDKYAFEGFEAQDGQPDLITGENGFAVQAHKLGLSQRQAAELFKWYSGRAEQQGAQTDEQRAVAHSAEWDQVKETWGAAFDKNLSIAKQAAGQLGFSAEELEHIEAALGTKWLLTTFHRLGGRLGETDRAPAANAGGREGFEVSPSAAREQLDELMRDEQFQRRYFQGDAAAAKRVADLTQVIAGNGLVRPDNRGAAAR